MRLLIVEDETLVALAMENVLSEAGHHVIGLARDAPMALSIVADQKPDLALVDFHLGSGPNGATLAHDLLLKYGVRSIYVSANPGDCHTYGRHTGAVGCLSKPFTEDQLVTGIAAVEVVFRGRNPTTIPEPLELYVVL
jgi:DNA-binding response OmpR family regulator